MTSKLKQVFQSRKGNSTYLIGVIVMLVLLMTMYSIMFFTSQQAVISNIINTSQNTLDAYVDQTSVEIYNSVKSSHEYTHKINTTQYTAMLRDNLHLDENLECFYDGDGKLKYQLSDVDLTLDDNTLQLTASIHMKLPFYFLGVIPSSIDSNFNISSHFNFK